ncbi:prolipoprotein diacylglyceryl transferase [Bdellovibrio bacteriovorus]|uniref:Phosphatidylglycerol--prolipoprotein diacylglyceryl transferase n=1 Tax=Bdellovibrio bacteriovorus TaxID=959 RepID=A0A150WKL7_BDEBC|nr:prolipoprotein diacylglyceryl transferase [Bdellovibrio bacteriovorus]KYG64549.1 prolipoprotein diacylglyceryl transferase [Bdellovibrio bacteriovorus]
MVHDFDPFALRISGDFGIRWYGLSYMMGFICAYLLIRWLAQRQRSGLAPNMVGDFITYAAIGTLVGGRLGYVFFYGIDLLWKFKPEFPFWGVLAVNEGGMASHGGIIGIVIACMLYARKYGVNTLYLFDLVAVTGPLGVFFGRIANFINGELVGRECDPSYPFAVKFPQDIYTWPNQNFAKLGDLTPVMEKVGVAREQWLELVDKYRFDGSAREQVYSLMTKAIDAIQNGNEAAKEAIAPLLTPRYPSQLFAAFGEGLLLFLLLFFLWRRPRKPGFIAACFIIFYAIVRIADEQFRMPDAHIGFQWMGLTRGQLLSIGMLILGFVMMFVWTRASSLQIPGWGRGQSIKLNRK